MSSKSSIKHHGWRMLCPPPPPPPPPHTHNIHSMWALSRPPAMLARCCFACGSNWQCTSRVPRGYLTTDSALRTEEPFFPRRGKDRRRCPQRASAKTKPSMRPAHAPLVTHLSLGPLVPKETFVPHTRWGVGRWGPMQGEMRWGPLVAHLLLTAAAGHIFSRVPSVMTSFLEGSHSSSVDCPPAWVKHRAGHSRQMGDADRRCCCCLRPRC